MMFRTWNRILHCACCQVTNSYTQYHGSRILAFSSHWTLSLWLDRTRLLVQLDSFWGTHKTFEREKFFSWKSMKFESSFGGSSNCGISMKELVDIFVEDSRALCDLRTLWHIFIRGKNFSQRLPLFL